jgi:hypothetical protein
MVVDDPGTTGWDFFVSYQQRDQEWAEWIAWQLEDAGLSALLQGWDFVPGTNWIKLMQDGVGHGVRVIVVLSPAYIGSVFGAAEWQAIWAHDPDGGKRRVIPVRVADCERPGLLAGIVGIDLFGVPEPEALQRLQDGIQQALVGRAKPLTPPSFPAAPTGTTSTRVTSHPSSHRILGSCAAASAGGHHWIVEASPRLWLRQGPGFEYPTVGWLDYGQRAYGHCAGVESGGTTWYLLRRNGHGWAWGNSAYLQSI